MVGSGFIGSRLSRRAKRQRIEEEAEVRASYDAHGAEIFGLAVRSLGDRGLAEEVVQETFVRAWKARDRFDSAIGSRRTWLFSIARNLIVDAVRARSSRPKSGGAVEEGRVPDTDHTEVMLQRMQIDDALSRISEDHRHVILEVHLRGRPYAEVARELGVSAGTLRSRTYYALKSLRLVLEEIGYAG